MHRTIRKRSRLGFTLIELLVVIAIIAVLASLTSAAVMKFIGAGAARSTDATIQMVKSRLDKRWREVADEAEKQAIPAALQTNVDTLAGGDALTSKRARAIYVKLRLKHAFPTEFREVYNPYLAGYAMKGYQDWLTERGFSSGNYGTFTPEQQRAVCLLMILEKGGATGNELAGATTAFGNSPGGKEVRGLVDGWGNPLLFCRWATGSTKLNPSGAGAVGSDTSDPQGYLAASAWVASANHALAVSAVGHALPNGAAYKLRPIVASAGPDKVHGLDLTTFAITNTAQATDNRYSTDNN